MKTLYIDNYRGFFDTYLDLKDVNFFVGENSTGKTSILSLINILSMPYFWFRQEFNLPKDEPYLYGDIASIASKFFQIGIYYKDVDKENNRMRAILLKFVNNSGSPDISNINYLTGEYLIKIKKISKNIYYKISKLPDVLRNFTDIKFKLWVSECGETETGFKLLKSNMEIINDIYFTIISVEQEYANKYGIKISNDIKFPFMLNSLRWIAPVRAKPKRIYDSYKFEFSSEGLHTPLLLKSLLSSNAESASNNVNYLKKIGEKSGLFQTIAVKNYGRQKNSPFEINILFKNTPYRISNVGYGVSQVLPILVEMLASRNKDVWFVIQQPEVHLHPKAQATFGDFVYEIAKEEKTKFLIETHSDYIIDRFRIATKKDDNKHDLSSQVVFFEKTNRGNKLFPIAILSNGQYSEEQPTTFREFFIDEQIELLEV